MTVRIVLVDDHPLVLDGLVRLFETEPDFEIVATCSDGEQALQAVLDSTPDILVLDLSMPRMGGLAVIRELRQRESAIRIVLLTAALDENEVLEAVRLGVRGVVLKAMAPQLLLQCMRQVHEGGQWLERDLVGRALEKVLQREARLRDAAALLTPRERELVGLVAGGLSNREIAERLFITEGTVKVHLHRIYEKINVKSRVALTRYAQDKGLI